MTQAEMKSKASVIEKRFSERYETRLIENRQCFLRPDGVLFALDFLGAYGALVVEYAESVEEAKLNRFEDGDLFYLEEMDEDTMFRAMIQEIEQ